MFFHSIEHITYTFIFHCNIVVDDVWKIHPEPAAARYAACFTMLFIKWVRAELEYICVAACKGSQSFVPQET